MRPTAKNFSWIRVSQDECVSTLVSSVLANMHGQPSYWEASWAFSLCEELGSSLGGTGLTHQQSAIKEMEQGKMGLH